MYPSSFVVVLDANVLYPMTLRDTLLRAAADGLYQVRWSAQILDEATRNLVSNAAMTEVNAQRLRAQLAKVFPEAEVVGFEPLVGAMQNHPDDRHVAAAAVKTGAQVIVTANLADFAPMPEGVEAQSPDEFLGNLFDLAPDRFVRLLRDQASDMTRPPVTFAELLERLGRVIPSTISAVRQVLNRLTTRVMPASDPRELVKSFHFWDGRASGLVALELEFHDGKVTKLALPVDDLRFFDREITSSLLRCASARKPSTEHGWELRVLEPAVAGGPEVEIVAQRLTKVSLYEALDGTRIRICFSHPDSETWAEFSVQDAERLVAKVREFFV